MRQVTNTCRGCKYKIINFNIECWARGRIRWARGMAASVRDGYGEFRQPKFECGCCETLVFTLCGVRQNLYVFSLYRNLNLDDHIFDCLLTSMAALQAEEMRASFLFVGDLNGHHQEWLGSTTTNRHGIATFDFSNVSGCHQLVVGPPKHVVEHLTSWWLMFLT